jgi:hypothetical protein
MSRTNHTRSGNLIPGLSIGRLMTALVTLSIGTILIITIVPVLHTRNVQSGLKRAANQINAGTLDDARQTLRSIQAHVFASPPLAAQFGVLAIRVLVHANEIPGARNIAEWMRTTTDTRHGIRHFGGSRTTGPLGVLKERGEKLALLLTTSANREPFEWDPWQGYRAMFLELDLTGNVSATREAARSLNRIAPDNPLKRRPVSTRPAPQPRRPRTAQAQKPAPVKSPATPRATSAPRAHSAWLNRLITIDKDLDASPSDKALRRKRDTLLRTAEAAWGLVIVSSAHVYDVPAARQKQVKRRGVLKRGTMLDIFEFHAAGSDTLAFGRIAQDAKSKEVAVRIRDLVLYPGALDETPEHVRDLQRDRRQTQDQLAALKKSHLRDRLTATAEGRAFLRAKKTRDAFYDKMKPLLDDVEQGGAEMTVLDELREMKYAQRDIDQAYEKARATLGRTPLSSPAIRRLEEKLQAIEARLNDRAASEK